MPSLFPGMNPYLENPELWSEVHHRLITAIADAIAPPIRPKYRVAIEKRTYLSDGEESVLVGIPDVSVLSQRPTTPQTPSISTLHTQSESVTVTLPMPQELTLPGLKAQGFSGDFFNISPVSFFLSRGRKFTVSTRSIKVLSLNAQSIDVLFKMLSVTFPQSAGSLFLSGGNDKPLFYHF